MTKRTILVCFCLVVVACSNKKEITPANILPVQKMAKVMVDVHLLEAASNLFFDKKLIAEDMAPAFDIFKKYNITKKQYQESFAYYNDHLDSLDEIYQLVLIELSKMQAEVMNKKNVKATISYPLVFSPTNPFAPSFFRKANSTDQLALWKGVVTTSGENE